MPHEIAITGHLLRLGLGYRVLEALVELRRFERPNHVPSSRVNERQLALVGTDPVIRLCQRQNNCVLTFSSEEDRVLSTRTGLRDRKRVIAWGQYRRPPLGFER